LRCSSRTPPSLGRDDQNPGDRTAAAWAATEAVGGSLEAIYLMFGERDGMAILDVPDAETAAACAIAVTSTGAFRSVQTTQLIAPEDLPRVLERAGQALGSYTPPGQ
jgi:uncharacterized protein with GYD domain